MTPGELVRRIVGGTPTCRLIFPSNEFTPKRLRMIEGFKNKYIDYCNTNNNNYILWLYTYITLMCMCMRNILTNCTCGTCN